MKGVRQPYRVCFWPFSGVAETNGGQVLETFWNLTLT